MFLHENLIILLENCINSTVIERVLLTSLIKELDNWKATNFKMIYMKSENYFYTSEESTGDMTQYEEQLLLNYDDYLDGAFEAELRASNHYNLELGELEEDLEDDMDSEYDENDWEEVESDNGLEAEYDKNEEEPGTFLMKN